MVKQYQISENPSVDNDYMSLAINPLIRSVQLALDLANLVGEGPVNSKNPIIANVLKNIFEAVDYWSTFTPSAMDCKEKEIDRAVRDYANSVSSESVNKDSYDSFIVALEVHIELFES